jgi:tetratricopeptide (TPR) repeat protein
MGITTEQYQRIIRFLDASMEEAEMDAFEKELSANPEMRLQLEFEQSVSDDFISHNKPGLKDINSPKEGVKPEYASARVNSKLKWIGAIAAVVTACMLLAIFWEKREKTPALVAETKIDTSTQSINSPVLIVPKTDEANSSPTELELLFNKYFRKDSIPEDCPLFLARALTQYESGNYLPLQQIDLTHLPRTRGKDEKDNKKNTLQLGYYYKGLAYLQTQNTREAKENLEWVLKHQTDRTLRIKAQWYLTLTYVKENNREKVIELCQEIISSHGNPLLTGNARKILDVVRK